MIVVLCNLQWRPKYKKKMNVWKASVLVESVIWRGHIFKCFFFIYFVTVWKLGNFRKLTSHSFQSKRQIITPGGVDKLKYKNSYHDKR